MVNTRAKGKRNQRKCVEHLVKEENYDRKEIEVQTDNKFGNNDFWNMFDIIALGSNGKPRFIQVKSNRFGGLKDIKEFALEHMNLDHCNVEIWTWFDYKGWAIQKLEEKGWTVTLDER